MTGGGRVSAEAEAAVATPKSFEDIFGDMFGNYAKMSTASPEMVTKTLAKERGVFETSMLDQVETDIAAGNRVLGGTFIRDAVRKMTGEQLADYRRHLAAEQDRARRIIEVCASAEEAIGAELVRLSEVKAP